MVTTSPVVVNHPSRPKRLRVDDYRTASPDHFPPDALRIGGIFAFWRWICLINRSFRLPFGIGTPHRIYEQQSQTTPIPCFLPSPFGEGQGVRLLFGVGVCRC